MKLITAIVGATLALAVGLSAVNVQDTKAQETEAKEAAAKVVDEAAMIAEQMPTYPMTTCVISGEPMEEGKAQSFLHEGRLVRTCCKSCIKAFKKDPAALMAKIDQAIVKAQAASYPLKDCAVSGEALGEMGDPVDVFHGTRLLRLCCKGCVKAYKKDPAALVAKLDAAYIAAQKPTYKATKCLVSGEDLGSMGDPVDMLYGNTLVRLCCKGCVKGFKKDPASYMAELTGTTKKAVPATSAGKKG